MKTFHDSKGKIAECIQKALTTADFDAEQSLNAKKYIKACAQSLEAHDTFFIDAATKVLGDLNVSLDVFGHSCEKMLYDDNKDVTTV